MSLSFLSVRRAGVLVDGEPEVGWKLQPPPRADGETCGVVRQLAEDRPADGFPQRVLRSPEAAGTEANQLYVVSVDGNGSVISRMTTTKDLFQYTNFKTSFCRTTTW